MATLPHRLPRVTRDVDHNAAHFTFIKVGDRAGLLINLNRHAMLIIFELHGLEDALDEMS